MCTIALPILEYLATDVLQVEVDDDVIEELAIVETEEVFVGDGNGAFGRCGRVGEESASRRAIT